MSTVHFSKLPVHRFRGGPQRIGKHYGQVFGRAAQGFLSAELKEFLQDQALAREATECIRKHCPHLNAFLQGCAHSSGLSLQRHVLLLLHEEFSHLKVKQKPARSSHSSGHCTALAASGREFSTSVGALIGQNWDWGTELLPWATLNTYHVSPSLHILAYSYPGLPVCLGLNSHGLGLVWTGSGYYPPVKPRIGVPSYALTFELLFRRNVEDALEFLYTLPISGPSIFFLGDSGGGAVMVEITHEYLSITDVDELEFRANHFCDPKTIQASKQILPPNNRCHSKKRMALLQKFKSRQAKPISVESMKQGLSLRDIFIDFDPIHLSLDQFVIDCRKRSLFTRRGVTQGKWYRHNLVQR